MKPKSVKHAATLALSVAVSSTIPRLKALADTHAAEFEKVLWPTGAPRTVTWNLLRQQQIEDFRASTSALVERDIAIAERRGHAWPSGSSIRRETAVRVGIADALLARADTDDVVSVLDLVLFGEAKSLPPMSLRKLFEASATLMLKMSRRLGERDPSLDPVETGRMLALMFGEMLATLNSLLHRVDDKEAGAIVVKLLESLAPLRDMLEAQDDTAPPA